MRKVSCLVMALILSICMGTALADWMPDDGHKMHFPQYPDLLGWNVNATNPVILADDWMCSQSGPVTDVHFWGSWMGGITGAIISFNISIHADIPANPPVQPYSMPGATLWEYEVPFAWVIAQELSTDLDEGWYDPASGVFNYPDHNVYFQYNIFLDQYIDPADLFVQEEGVIYWLNISATVADPAVTQWGWKSSQDHWNDDAVFAFWGNLEWVDLYEPPDFIQSLDLAFVITGPDEDGACCYPDPTNGQLSLCIQTTQSDCVNNLLGVWEGPGTVCQGMEACCLIDGSCLDADALCCINELGGTPQGPGSACGPPEACCFSDGSCADLDPLCCIDQGGTPQGPGTMCTTPVACCLNDGSCIMVDPECCDDLGGYLSPFSAVCLGDNNGNGTDDACEEPAPTGACCYDDGTSYNSACIVTTQDSCINQYFGSYQGDGSQCATIQACCLSDGTCIMADAFCCANELGGTPQGTGTTCTAAEACCMQDGSCTMLDPLCCFNIGGEPQGAGSSCTAVQACCMPDGSCAMYDPVCCDEMGGTPQGTGSSCSAAPVACCLTDGSCLMTDPLCCDDLGGTVSPYSSVCLGDNDGNGTDDACEMATGACCYDDGTCTVETADGCANLNGDYKGDGTTCKGDSDGDGNDDICVQPWPSHKMHYPQPPDESGWDVEATVFQLADDWRCTETGFVKDIHFWGSWLNGIEVPITHFMISIWSDVPADPPGVPYSMPGQLLWELVAFEFEATPFDPPTLEGWYDPSQELILPDNHQAYYRYDIYLEEPQWFMQEEGTIYWLSIQAVIEDPSVTRWGWKSSYEHWNDDAVWLQPGGGWIEMYEPADPLINAFGAIMGEGNILIDGFGVNAYGEGWYEYPTGWWNVWFYDHPFTYDRFKEIFMHLDLVPTGPASSIVLAINWSTDLWSTQGNPPGQPRRPPLPGDEPEEEYIGRYIVYQGEVMPGMMEFDYVIPDYNPEWVSVDIMGQNFDIPSGDIMHACRTSLDLAFVITGGTECSGECGDANGDGTVNVSDAVWIINYVFVGGMAPVPLACGDANSDCTVNISDAVMVINYVFVGGMPPGDCCPGGPNWWNGDCCPFTP